MRLTPEKSVLHLGGIQLPFEGVEQRDNSQVDFYVADIDVVMVDEALDSGGEERGVETN